MRRISLILFLSLLLWSCKPPITTVEKTKAETATASPSEHVAVLAPLIDPAKLATLTGKRAAIPRLRKACYWLEMARKDGLDLEATISKAHAATGHDSVAREAEQSAAPIRNVTILERQRSGTAYRRRTSVCGLKVVVADVISTRSG